MMEYSTVVITEEVSIGQARRLARRLVQGMGFTDAQIGHVDILINELGTNALKYGRGTGQVYLSRCDHDYEPEGIEIVYVDKGPGIEDPAVAFEDGFTTSNSLGAGLGALRRQADEFHLYSTPQSHTRRLSLYGRTTHGTAMVLRKYVDAANGPEPGRAIWGALTKAKSGELTNGDGYVIHQEEDRLLIAVIDGLGHGDGAEEATRKAIAEIKRNASEKVDRIIGAAHEALKQTRGAVLGLASIDCSARVVEYAGVGNTDFRVIGGEKTMRLVSLNGTVGSRIDRLKVFTEQLPRVANIVMSTDGISERWDAEAYPGLLGLHPQLMSAVLMRDYGRSNDDATILCGRLSF